jgi:hypothetical protein
VRAQIDSEAKAWVVRKRIKSLVLASHSSRCSAGSPLTRIPCCSTIVVVKIKAQNCNVTWHCWGPPCRVGDAVFGLCFFTGVDETAAGKLEFDDGVTVVARVVMVSGCWVVTTIDADDDDVFCE